ncbi:ATP-binding protein, partial [Streptococcus pyogenes]|uniref:ATP-binding protein n=1 Tax=Streptococcus pyogenes TaxID=1314 RepID=UPI003D9FD345
AQMVMSLTHFYSALPRVLTLARSLLDLLMEGYVGREPDKARHFAILERRRAVRLGLTGMTAGIDDPDQVSSIEELSVALMGEPGTGKSKFLKRFSQLLEEPIYHEKYGVWQLPILRIRFPPDGRNLHALATYIILAIDRKLPEHGYREKYLRTSQKSGNAMERLRIAEDLLHLHFVGLLLVDEAQDSKFAEKSAGSSTDPLKDAKPEGEQPILTLLIAASNTFGIPLVLVGTGELHDVMQRRMSRGRRCDGYGVEYWGKLKMSGSLTDPDEYELL